MAHAKPNHVRPTTHAGYEERVTDGSDTIEESGQDLCGEFLLFPFLTCFCSKVARNWFL
jgi:hypothetical protein